MTKNTWIKITAIGLITATAIGVYFYKIHLSNVPVLQEQYQAVNAFRVEETPVNPETSFVAKIEAKDTVGLRARVTGFLQKRLFKEGQIVQAGDPLFLIEKVNFESGVREAEANYKKALANEKNTKAQYERTKTLFKTKDVSAARLDEAEANYQSAQADVSQMKARLDLAKQDLDYTEVKAPMTGKIGESKFSEGELISPESGVLATIVTVDPMDAVFSVSENQLLSLRALFNKSKNIDVRFITADGQTYSQIGHISFVDVKLDEAMNTLKLKASFPNPDGQLISGQYGRVILTGQEPVDQLVIPQRAIQRDMSSSFVYVITPQNTIEKRTVKEGIELPDFKVIITEGLTPGETIVTDGFQKIIPGMSVTAIFPENK